MTFERIVSVSERGKRIKRKDYNNSSGVSEHYISINADIFVSKNGCLFNES